MNDILPPVSAQWEWLEEKVRALMDRHAACFGDSVLPGLRAEGIQLLRYHQATDDERKIGETPGRAECGLPETGFVFCSFNNNYKYKYVERKQHDQS